MKNIRKFLTLLMAFAMCMSLMSISAFAESKKMHIELDTHELDKKIVNLTDNKGHTWEKVEVKGGKVSIDAADGEENTLAQGDEITATYEKDGETVTKIITIGFKEGNQNTEHDKGTNNYNASVSDPKSESDNGGNDNQANGGNDNQTNGGNDNQTTGGNDNQTSGGNDNQTNGGNDNQTNGGNDNQTTGGNDDQTTDGNDNQTTGGNDNQTTGGDNGQPTDGDNNNQTTNDNSDNDPQPRPRRPRPVSDPVVVEEEIAEEETPLSAAPVELEEEPTPLAAAPELPAEEMEEFEEEDVPLAAVPATSDVALFWLAASALSGLGLGAMNLKKREEEN